MALSSDLASLFVKTTKDDTNTKTESTAYGTVVRNGDDFYVQLDGSDLLMPVAITADVNNGERVTVTIKNHKATVTGNTTEPAGRHTDIENIDGRVNRLDEDFISAEARITKLEDSIEMMVQDENGNSLMQQTGSGWVFSIQTISEQLKDIAQDAASTAAGEVQSNLDILRGEVAAQDVTDYLIVGKDSNNKTTLELGATDGSSRLALTNNRLEFTNGQSTAAYIANDTHGNSKLYIEEADVTNELRFGNFVWKKRANGNMGIMWVGGGN